MLFLLFEKAWETTRNEEQGRRISVNSASYKSIGATVMPSPRSRSCQKFSSPRMVNYCPILLRETSVPRTLADGLYFSARASPRCNLYLITAGNILDLKSFLVKYRNIKETSGAPPQGERASGRRKWFTFHEFFTATWTTRKPPKLQPLEPSFSLPLVSFCLVLLPSSTLSISSRSARTFHRHPVHHSDIPLIFLSCSHFLTISFYSFFSSVDQLRKLLKSLVVHSSRIIYYHCVVQLLSLCRSIVIVRKL